MSIPILPTPAATAQRGIAFTVHGTPAPQGSKKHVGGGRMVESSKKVAPWRAAVAAAAAEAMDNAVPFDSAVEVVVTFMLPRPATVSVAKRPFPTVYPDVDKLARSTLDGLTAGSVLTDDARVVDLHARKRYADTPGAEIIVREVAA